MRSRVIGVLAAVALTFAAPANVRADAGVDGGAAKGDACSAATECASGFCVDGVCCATECAKTTSCSGGVFKPAPTCATGSCTESAGTTCAPYACSGDKCASTCSSDADCSAGNKCVGGGCRVTSRSCSADGAISIAADGTTTSCWPYACNPSDGKCYGACATDAECAKDRRCLDGRMCTDPNSTGKANADQADGACAYGASSTTPLWLALVALSLLRRR
ncbi:MAG: hypothetical protein HYV09_01515 [Deltaproteobacteria bacterium]|nr:hypothetical protein [Deltaproteobacteria bacterium]